MGSHALFSPSAADRWTRCPASIAMTHGLPNQTNEASEEGTMLHDVMLQHIKNGVPFSKFNLTDEQLQAVMDCADWVNDNLPGERFYETKVYFGDLVGQSNEESSGTVDIASVENNILHVADYKFGHNYVNPINNAQGILYSLGLINLLEMIGYNIEEVHFNIIQPRTGNQTTNGEFVITRSELDTRAKEISLACAEAKESLKISKQQLIAKLVPGDKQCKYCKANYFCPALKKFAASKALELQKEFDVVELDKNVVAERVQLMSDEKISKALDMLPTLEVLIDAVKKESLDRALKGCNIPNYKLIEGRQGNRKWGDEDAIVKALLDKGLADAYSHKIISPAEAEIRMAKELGMSKKEAKEFLDDYVVRSDPKPSLVPAESRGGALWQPKVSLDEFDVVEEVKLVK